jgi:hypothetical protein
LLSILRSILLSFPCSTFCSLLCPHPSTRHRNANTNKSRLRQPITTHADHEDSDEDRPPLLLPLNANNIPQAPGVIPDLEINPGEALPADPRVRAAIKAEMLLIEEQMERSVVEGAEGVAKAKELLRQLAITHKDAVERNSARINDATLAASTAETPAEFEAASRVLGMAVQEGQAELRKIDMQKFTLEKAVASITLAHSDAVQAQLEQRQIEQRHQREINAHLQQREEDAANLQQREANIQARENDLQREENLDAAEAAQPNLVFIRIWASFRLHLGLRVYLV